jgi:NLR family CARD domain-containing protein 3
MEEDFPLFVASQYGHDSVCDLLLSHGADVNRAVNDGVTPLYIASQNGHDSVCGLLLSHGGKI